MESLIECLKENQAIFREIYQAQAFSPQNYNKFYSSTLSNVLFSKNHQQIDNQLKCNQTLNLSDNESIEKSDSNNSILCFSREEIEQCGTPNSKSKNKKIKISEKKILKNIFSNINNASKTLRFISFHNCGLLKIPQELYNLPKNIISLDLSLNYINVIPNEVKWGKLKGLNLKNNLLSEWPSILEPDKFTKLTYLSIGFNDIKKIPEFTKSFENLQYFDSSFTSIEKLPDWISKCERIVSLKLRGNNLLTSFSFKMILPMKTLRILDISNIELPNDESSIKLPSTLDLLIAKQNDKTNIPNGLFILNN